MARRKPNPKVSPYVENIFLHTLMEELYAILLFMRHQWYFLLAAICVIALLVYFLEPLPPSKVRIAKGQPNSTLEVDALLFKEAIEKKGINVELVESKGTLDSLALLEAHKVDVALTQSGLPIAKDSNIFSLGSIGYQAVWFFYTGPEYRGDDIYKRFEKTRIYANRPGSGTNFMVKKLLGASQKFGSMPFTIVENMSPKEAVKALKNGQIDGLFLLAGYDSRNIQELFQDARIHILNFPVAKALALNIRGVDVVTLPKGAYTLSPPRPPEDIAMIAAATTILARNDLHPEIQYLLLDASKEIYENGGVVFDRPGGFPAFTEKGIQRSPIAIKYYENGPPYLAEHLPYWLASFLNHAWFSLLAIAAITYPLLQFRPKYRMHVYTISSDPLYQEVFEITNQVENAQTSQEINQSIKKFHAVNQKVLDLWVPIGADADYATLLNAIAVLLAQIKERRLLIEGA